MKTKKIQIKDLKQGQKIKTYDPETGEVVFKEVTSTWTTEVPKEQQALVKFNNGAYIECSTNHPFMILNSTGAVEERKPLQLKKGDIGISDSGEFCCIKEVIIGRDNPTEYIDITVEDTHTFFAQSDTETDMVLTHNSQGGVRGAAATVYYPWFHYEYGDLVVLKNNQGTEETRERHMDYSVQWNDYFDELLEDNNKEVFFFCPKDVPDLFDAFYSGNDEEFKRLYELYSEDDSIRKKVMPNAMTVLTTYLKEFSGTGRVYSQFMSACVNNGPFNKVNGKDYWLSSNLCFTGDTLVATADGSNARTIKELAEESKGKNQFPVYSARYGTRGWVSEIKDAVAFHNGHKEVVTVKLSDGSSFRCTEDHRLAMPDGNYVEAKDALGVELESFFTSRGESRKYRHINSCSNGHSKQHLMIWKYNYGDVPTGHHIDHIENIADDSIENLQCMERTAHFTKTGIEFSGKANAVYKLKDPERCYNNRSNKAFMENNPRFGGVSNEEIIAIAMDLRENDKEITFENLRAVNENIPRSFSKNRFGGRIKNLRLIVGGELEYTAPVRKEYIEKPKHDTYQGNGRATVTDVIYTGEHEDVYDLTVEDNHNFYIITDRQDDDCLECSGVLVHNCNEISLPIKDFELGDLDEEGMIALCTLSSINWGVVNKVEDLEEPCRLSVRALDNLLDYQDYPVEQAERFTKRFRALGIGIIGLAHFLAKRDLTYGIDALETVDTYMEAMTYYLTDESVKLAEERGPCEWHKETCYADGIFPWERRNKNVDLLVKHNPKFDWEPLRARMIQYGIRNATLMAIAPTESSSQLTGETNGIEPPIEKVTTKTSKDGSLKIVVPEINKLKNKYDYRWEMGSPRGYISVMAVLQKWIDQSISANLHYNPEWYEDGRVPMSEMVYDFMFAKKFGLKNLYYCNTLDQGEEEEQEPEAVEVVDDVECDSCVI